MKVFVTGATGFIGSRVAAKLAARGNEVWALTHSGQGAAALASQGVHCVPGAITDAASMTAAMRGSDVVYHLAGWYKIGARDRSQAEVVNVEGTRTVLNLARQLAIPRVVYTSTIAVFGDTHGVLADEKYVIPGTQNGLAPHFLTEYDRTKWLAHYQVALPMIHAGAPITIVMPGIVYGPGDLSLVGDLMRKFYLGQLPFVPGPETVLTYAFVDDIADGHILAAERGRAGETYLLTGPALSFGEAFDLWADVTGLPPTRLRVPAALLRPAAPLLTALGSALPLPELFSGEGAAMMGVSYLGTSAKARSELGWSTRSPRDGFAETFAAIAGRDGPAPEGWLRRNQPVVIGLAVAAALSVAARGLAGRGRRG